MLEIGPVATPAADLVRLVAVPGFVYAAYTDHRRRRVPNRLWPPVLVIALLALAIEGWHAYTVGGFIWQQFALVTALSIAILVPIAYGFWYFGGFGGADAKAIMVLAVLFPGVPTYVMGDWTVPVVEPAAGLFALTILTNAALIGLVYPVSLAVRNAMWGDFGLLMFIGRQVDATAVVDLPGRLLESPDGFDRRGLDLDALRMYLAWRQCTLTDLREAPEHYRATRPAEPGDPGDGAIADGGHPDDPWAATAFLTAVAGSAYGATPTTVRNGLEVLTRKDRVWYSPGIPFVVLIFIGLTIALTYGDLFTAVLDILAG